MRQRRDACYRRCRWGGLISRGVVRRLQGVFGQAACRRSLRRTGRCRRQRHAVVEGGPACPSRRSGRLRRLVGSEGARGFPRWQLGPPASGSSVEERVRFGHPWGSASSSSPSGGSAALFGTVAAAVGRPVGLLGPAQPGRPVVDAAAAWHWASPLAPVGFVGSASCKCWHSQSVGFQVFDLCSEDLLSGRGSEVVHHWREDFRDDIRAGVFRG
jgi:hypothetical protein